jgi:CrcB protein
LSTTSVRWLLIALGGAAGSLMRYLVSGWVQRGFGPAFPWGTFVVNLTGCFAMGLLAGLFQHRFLAGSEIRLLLLVGLLGGYTTFSTFTLETLRLVQDGSLAAAAMNGMGSPLLALAGTWLGDLLARSI